MQAEPRSSGAYDDYYDIVVDIGKVGVETFATGVQELLVDYLRTKYGDSVANGCRDYWTGDRGRMRLAQSQYAGNNTNMGVEVSWRLIKAISSDLACFAQFLGTLCKFIRIRLRARAAIPQASLHLHGQARSQRRQ